LKGEKLGKRIGAFVEGREYFDVCEKIEKNKS
jgi:hypothetical protein